MNGTSVTMAIGTAHHVFGFADGVGIPTAVFDFVFCDAVSRNISLKCLRIVNIFV